MPVVYVSVQQDVNDVLAMCRAVRMLLDGIEDAPEGADMAVQIEGAVLAVEGLENSIEAIAKRL